MDDPPVHDLAGQEGKDDRSLVDAGPTPRGQELEALREELEALRKESQERLDLAFRLRSEEMQAAAAERARLQSQSGQEKLERRLELAFRLRSEETQAAAAERARLQAMLEERRSEFEEQARRLAAAEREFARLRGGQADTEPVVP